MSSKPQQGVDFLIGRRQGLTPAAEADNLKERIAHAVKLSHDQGVRAGVRARDAEEKSLADFRAQAVLHSAVAELTRAKLSAATGRCTHCHVNMASQMSHYHRCDACDRSIGE